jgi:plastocyanin
MLPRHLAVIGAALLTVTSVSGCGGGSSGYPTGSGGQNPPPGGQPPPSSTTNAITVENNRFNPAATTVTLGTTVTWTWDACTDDGYGGRTCVDHNVTFDGGGGGSATQSAGTYTRQFSTLGNFSYRCTVHGPSMTGQVVVR